MKKNGKKNEFYICKNTNLSNDLWIVYDSTQNYLLVIKIEEWRSRDIRGRQTCQ